LAIHRNKALLVTRASSRRSQQAAPPLGTGVSGWREHPSQGGWHVYPAGSSERSPGSAPGSSSSTRPVRPQSSTAGAEDGLPAAATNAVNQPVSAPDGETEENHPVALTVQVEDSTNLPVADVTVVLTAGGLEVGRDTTPGDGEVVFQLQPGNYTVSVYKEWFLPEPAVANVVLAGAQTVQLTLDEVKFALHVDANRDGTVDDAPATDDWTWGVNGSGAVILCNMDHDGAFDDGRTDASDQVINTQADEPDIAALQIRRNGVVVPPKTWILRLKILGGNRKNVRIFKGVTGGKREIVGPGSKTFRVRRTDRLTRWQFGIEAIQFANATWDGAATICLDVSKPAALGGGRTKYRSLAAVRVAPWMMPGPDEHVRTVYAVDAGDNHGTLDAIYRDVDDAGAAWSEYRSSDRWMQDCMEIGYTSLPRRGEVHRVDCALRAYRNGPLKNFPPTLLARDYGYYDPYIGTPPGTPNTTYDSFGNLECTPPVRDSRMNEYPFGRIYYGPGTVVNGFNPEVASFLARQMVQPPMTLDTTWLQVGHVDEIMGFLHNPAGAEWKKWKLLIASPRKAYEILDTVPYGMRMMRGRLLRIDGRHIRLECTVKSFLNSDTPLPDPRDPGQLISGPDLRYFNCTTIQRRIDGVLTTLEDDINLDRVNDVIEVPVVFFPHDRAYRTCSALTADMVNMLILDDRCVVPKPFGPVDHRNPVHFDLFEDSLQRDIIASLGGAAPALHFVDDWHSYHELLGEVHCGTNTRRGPVNRPLWLRSDAAKWWSFEP
jgi:protein-arginine deiminase